MIIKQNDESSCHLFSFVTSFKLVTTYFIMIRSLTLFHRSRLLYQRNSFQKAVATAHRPYSSDKEIPDSAKLHQSFHDQIKELEDERIELFGTNESVVSQSSSSVDSDEIELTVEEMNRDREAIYAFTEEEKTAWGSAGNSQPLSSEFLNAVKKARQAKEIYEKSMEKDVEDKMSSFVQEAVNEQQHENSVNSSENEGSINISSQPFTHLNKQGDQVCMVDVGHKKVTRRTAVARSAVVFPPEVMDAFGITSDDGRDEMIGKKGPIFSTARLAGIMGAKRTSDLIPLCHPLPLDKVHIDILLEGNRVMIVCECSVTHKTGVEMEALVGANVAALTIYDMVKAVSHNVRIESTELVTKTGGKRRIEDGVEKT